MCAAPTTPGHKRQFHFTSISFYYTCIHFTTHAYIRFTTHARMKLILARETRHTSITARGHLGEGALISYHETKRCVLKSPVMTWRGLGLVPRTETSRPEIPRNDLAWPPPQYPPRGVLGLEPLRLVLPLHVACSGRVRQHNRPAPPRAGLPAAVDQRLRAHLGPAREPHRRRLVRLPRGMPRGAAHVLEPHVLGGQPVPPDLRQDQVHAAGARQRAGGRRGPRVLRRDGLRGRPRGGGQVLRGRGGQGAVQGHQALPGGPLQLRERRAAWRRAAPSRCARCCAGCALGGARVKPGWVCVWGVGGGVRALPWGVVWIGEREREGEGERGREREREREGARGRGRQRGREREREGRLCPVGGEDARVEARGSARVEKEGRE
ncbi:hypothetical protein T484DRAFT_2694875 [Baffinella frigidus]|nr:hypothetical protein T484DRAFT_2694875 [Cryptophyta sp. CCMP2293]